MNTDNSNAAELNTELGPREHLLWSGRPKAGLRLHATDALLIPFSLLWCGFAFFWESVAIGSGAPFFFALWGIPFVLAGLYFVFGRFFYDAYRRSRTTYGVTNQRVIIVSHLYRRTVKSVLLQSLYELTLDEHHNGSGTITFGPLPPFATWNRYSLWSGLSQSTVTMFDGIAHVRGVYELIRQTQAASVQEMFQSHAAASPIQASEVSSQRDSQEQQ